MLANSLVLMWSVLGDQIIDLTRMIPNPKHSGHADIYLYSSDHCSHHSMAAVWMDHVVRYGCVVLYSSFLSLNGRVRCAADSHDCNWSCSCLCTRYDHVHGARQCRRIQQLLSAVLCKGTGLAGLIRTVLSLTPIG